MVSVVVRLDLVREEAFFDESMPGSRVKRVLKLWKLASLIVQREVEIVVAASDEQHLKAVDALRLSESEDAGPFAGDTIIDAAISERIRTEQVCLRHGLSVRVIALHRAPSGVSLRDALWRLLLIVQYASGV